MASVNKVILVGNLGHDPSLRYTPDGTAVVSMSLATTSNWKDRATGERREDTEWHKLVAYGRAAEVLKEYRVKGNPLYVEGRLKTRKWTDMSGADRYTTEIIVENFQLLPTGQAFSDRKEEAPQGKSPAPAGGGGVSDMDDDIPFIRLRSDQTYWG